VKPRTIVLPALALGGLILGGCSGGGDSPQTAITTTTSATGSAAPGTPIATTTGPGGVVSALPACYKPGTVPPGSAFKADADPARSIPRGEQEGIRLVAASADTHRGENNLAIGITDTKDQPIGGAKIRLTVYDLKDGKQTPVCQVEPLASAPGVGPEFNHKHSDGSNHVHGGETDDRIAYYARIPFDRSGPWGLAAEAILKDGKRQFGTLLMQVADRPSIPQPGTPAPKSDNLTKKDVANISEIDSGSPPNDMHDVKIKDAIAAGRPLVIVFSTPAYCQSLFCGPVNEEVEALFDIYKDRVDFVHIEVWRDFQKKALNPTAREWLSRPDGGLSEPTVYVVGKDGVIYDVWEGPVARNIMEPAVKAVAGGATYRK
jgi:hypothetical protein